MTPSTTSPPFERAPADGDDLDGYVLEQQVGYVLRRAQQRHTAIFQALIAPVPLTTTQFAALVKLFEHGPVSQNRLGRLAAMDAATMQGVIRRLLERRYVVRNPDPGHRRRLLLNLTAEGRDVVRQSLASARAITRATLEPLTPEEQAILIALLQRLT